MLEGKQNVELESTQDGGLEEVEPAVRSRGPWTTFFSHIWEAAKPVWALYAACIFAVLTVYSMIGTPVLNPLMPVSLSSTSLATSTSDSVLVVDKMRTRLLFVNNKKEIVGIAETGQGVVPVDEVTDVVLGDDVAYVAGLTRREDGKCVASEAVLAFSLDGTFLRTLWQTNYNEDAYHPIPSIVDLEADDSGVTVLRRMVLGEDSRSVSLFHVGPDASEELIRTVTFDMPFYDVNYEQASDRLFVISFDGGVSVLDGDGTSRLFDGSDLHCKGLDASGDRAVLQDASSGELLLLDGFLGKPTVEPLNSVTRPKSARLSGDVLCVVCDDGSLWVENRGTGDSFQAHELTLAPSIVFSFAKYIVCIALIVVVTAMWAVRMMRNLLRENEIGKFRRVVITVVVTIIGVALVCLFNYTSYLDESEVRENQLRQMGSCLGYFSTEALGDSIMRETELMDALSTSDGGLDDNTLLRAANGLALSAHEGGMGVSCKLYVVSEDETQVRAVISSDYDVVLGERVFDERLSDALIKVVSMTNALYSDVDSVAESAAQSTTYLDFVSGDSAVGMSLCPLISQDGTCRMVAQVSNQQLTFVRGFLKDAADKMLALFLFAVGFYILSDEVLKFGNTLIEYQQADEKDVTGLCVKLTRPLEFLCGVTLFMDYALVAVMTRSLFLSKGAEASAIMISVPILASSVGMSVTDWVGLPLIKRRPIRTVTLAFVVIGIIAQIVCFASIRSNCFEWYVVGKLFMSFGYGFVTSVLYKLVYLLQDEDEAYSGIDQAWRSSGIIAGLVGGLLALLGNVWIYAASAAIGLVLFWGLWKALPRDPTLGRTPDQENAEPGQLDTITGQVSNVHRFLRSPQMILILLFGLVPITIAGGYKSYFLPLFLSDSSYTNTQISNYSVLCSLALYVATRYLRSFRMKSDTWLLTWASLAAIGVLFGIFARNQSASWAILAAILISVLCWLAKRCRSFARWFAQCEYNLDYDQAYEAVSGVESIVGNINSVAMGAFLSLGTTNGCRALAGFMYASALLFAITTRPYYQRSREKASSDSSAT